MEEIIEVVFEGLSFQNTCEMLKEFLSEGSIKDYTIPVDTPSPKVPHENKTLFDVLNAEKAFNHAFINLIKIENDYFITKEPSIKIDKDCSGFDIIFIFNLLTTRSSCKNLIDALYKFASSVAKKYPVTRFYCGLEPAIDFETRFFTNETLGPLTSPL